ncbi:MAG: anti-sigma factor family protein [Pyrinomonadaceae bacterium]
MKDEHIKRLLDAAPLSSLGEAEVAAVRAHTETCAECRRAFEAAQASTLMLKARTAEAFEPSPFFQTRVLAALRERRAAEEERWTLGRLWKSAGLLVSSLAATTAALAVFTFVAPSEQATAQEVASSGTYSAESVILDEGGEEQMTYDQVLTSLYGSEDEAAR